MEIAKNGVRNIGKPWIKVEQEMPLTPTLIDGASLLSTDELAKLGVLALESCDVLKNSYVRLRYKVIG